MGLYVWPVITCWISYMTGVQLCPSINSRHKSFWANSLDTYRQYIPFVCQHVFTITFRALYFSWPAMTVLECSLFLWLVFFQTLVLLFSDIYPPAPPDLCDTCSSTVTGMVAIMARWAQHTSVEPQRLQDHCWSVKAGSCDSSHMIVGLLRWESIHTWASGLHPQRSTCEVHKMKPVRMYLFSLLIFPRPSFFFWLSLNLKSKICLNWLQRAWRGFVSTVMRLLIGPEAHAANRPLLVCRGSWLAR